MRITGELSIGPRCSALEALIQVFNSITANVAERIDDEPPSSVVVLDADVQGLALPDIPGAEPGSVQIGLIGTDIGFSGGVLPSGSGTITHIQIIANVNGLQRVREIEFPQPIAVDALLAETARSGETSKDIEDYPGLVSLILPDFFFLDEQGTSLRDKINGFDTNDILDGKGGKDTILGKAGDDDIDGGGGSDTLNGGSGRDDIDAGRGNDTVDGGKGDDDISGQAGGDRLKGGRGDDRIDGGAGRDWLLGGKGDDTLNGGSGRDMFVFKRGDGDDIIEAFDVTQDQIRINGADRLRDLSFDAVGGDVVVSHANITVTVLDVTRAELRDPDIFGF